MEYYKTLVPSKRMPLPGAACLPTSIRRMGRERMFETLPHFWRFSRFRLSVPVENRTKPPSICPFLPQGGEL